jgi:hypothetical protein
MRKEMSKVIRRNRQRKGMRKGYGGMEEKGHE